MAEAFPILNNGRRRRRCSTSARSGWYTAWRIIRVSEREGAKAMSDVLIYGTGAIRWTPGADPQHIPVADLSADWLRTPPPDVKVMKMELPRL